MTTNDNHTPLVREPESTLTIRFQDCDPYGHLNNARYLDYFLDARMDHLKHFYGFDVFEHAQTVGAAWVVTKTQIAYLLPARPHEEVAIRTRALRIDASGFLVEGVMLTAQRHRVKSLVWLEFSYVTLATGRPTDHPEEFMTRFLPVRLELESPLPTFDERLDHVKSEFRRQPA